MEDERCRHWSPPQGIWAVLVRPLPGRPCAECEAEEYVAWQASVQARFDRALLQVSRGLDADWDAPLSA